MSDVDYPIVGHKEKSPICNHCKHDYTGHQLEIMCMDENNNCQMCHAALSGKFAIGRKDDSSKLRYSLLPVGTVNQVVKVLEYGASSKYEIDNWQKVPSARTRYYDAAMRHIDAWWNGELLDLDKGDQKGSHLPHLAHAICCLMFLMWFDNEQ